MDRIDDFKNKLEARRKPKNPDNYRERITHCHILYTDHAGKEHSFEVRGWGHIMGGKLDVGVVNWTLCAGPATITIDVNNVDLFRIVD